MATAKSTLLGKVLLITAASALFLALALFVLEKTHVINFYTKPVSETTLTEVRPVNSVDYTVEQTPTDETINSEKQNENSENTTSSNNTSTKFSILITRANYNGSNKLLTVGTLIEGLSKGSCKLEIINNNVVKLSQSSDIMQQGSYSTCQGFSTDVSGLVNDSYTVKITVSDGTNTNSASQDVVMGG